MNLARSNLLWCLLLLAVAVAATLIGWTGFIASDDALYHAGATEWLRDPPFPGGDHWTTRFPLVLSFAGVIALMGDGFAAFATTAVLFYLTLVGTMGAFGRSIGGARTGWITALIAATLPVVVAQATTVGVDLLEASLLLAGIALLTRAEPRIAHALAAGVCFGLAMLCRETTALPLVGLVPLFLLGRPVGRGALVAAGLGAAAVLGAEALFQGLVTGDPLRRYAIAFNHDSTIDRAANLEGNLLVHPAIDPLLVLLINNDFGLLFWGAIAALAAGAHRRIGLSARPRAIVLAAMAGASFLLVAVLTTKLVLNPRYFMLPALAAVLLVAVWLDRLATRWRVLALAALTASNLLLLSAGNAHPRWPMEALVAAARAHPNETVHGEPEDANRAPLALRFAGAGRLDARPALKGALLIVPADRAPSGRVLARYPSPPTRLGALIRAVGLEPLLPEGVARRLLRPNPTMVLVRAG
jgi:4-amino-4-deoxy-L-arabinose transferase-like glycosyltransferase